MLAKEDELSKVKERQEQAEKMLKEYESKQQQVGVCLWSAVSLRQLGLVHFSRRRFSLSASSPLRKWPCKSSCRLKRSCAPRRRN